MVIRSAWGRKKMQRFSQLPPPEPVFAGATVALAEIDTFLSTGVSPRTAKPHVQS
jgi:hypothetical protein